jgi:hypothetical protein
MCCRLRQNNWKIFRLDEEMTLHVANITRFSQWWKRANRAGFAFALSAKAHSKGNEKFGVHRTLLPLVWSGALFGILLLGFFTPLILFALFFSITNYKNVFKTKRQNTVWV